MYETDTLPAYVTNRKFELSVNITYQDNSTQVLSKSFDWRNTDWQYAGFVGVCKGVVAAVIGAEIESWHFLYCFIIEAGSNSNQTEKYSCERLDLHLRLFK